MDVALGRANALRHSKSWSANTASAKGAEKVRDHTVGTAAAATLADSVNSQRLVGLRDPLRSGLKAEFP